MRTFLSLHTPLDVQRLAIGGEAVLAEVYDEYGTKRIGQQVEVPPGESREVVFTLNGTLDLSGGYGLRVWSPPLATADRVQVRVAPAPGSNGIGTDVGTTVEGAWDRPGVFDLRG